MKDMSVAMLLLGFDPFAKQLAATFVQNDAFGLCTAEVDTDAEHVLCP